MASVEREGYIEDQVRGVQVGLILLGGRFSEMPSSSYTLMDIPYPAQKLVHIHPDPSELGRVYRADMAICAAPEEFVAALASLDAPAAPAWAERTETMHAAYLAWSTPPKAPCRRPSSCSRRC